MDNKKKVGRIDLSVVCAVDHAAVQQCGFALEKKGVTWVP